MSKLNKFQRLVADTYAGGDFAWVEIFEQTVDIGDGLFEFLMREFGDDEIDLETVLQRVRKAQEQVADVVDALEVLDA